MRAWWLAVVCACKGSDPPPPKPAPVAPAPAPRVTARLVHCAPAEIAPRAPLAAVEHLFDEVTPAPGLGEPIPRERPAGFVNGYSAHPRPPQPPVSATPTAPRPPSRVADVKVWTPYAAGEGLAPLDILTRAASDLEPAIRAQIAKLDACFGDRTGSLRAMLTVAFDGSVINARTGGIGDHDVEACVAGALVGIKVTAPPIISELSCDFERGAPAPWRLTLDGRYEVLGRGASASPDLAEPWRHVYAIVAAPEALGVDLARAMRAVRFAQGVLVAVNRDVGPPIFLGMARDARTTSSGDGEPIAIDLRGGTHACADGSALHGAAMRALNEECASAPCGTLSIAFDGSATAGQIAEQALAARGAGFARILVGGAGCAQ